MFWGGVFGAAKSENNNRYGITYLRILVHIYVISILLLLMMFAKGLIQIVSACLEFNSTRYGSIIESKTGQ
jgi:hypothetical protein